MKEYYFNDVFKLEEDSLLKKFLDDNFDNFTLAGFIDYVAKNDGNTRAICHVSENQNKTMLTYSKLSEKSNQMANLLKRKWVSKGDVVALVLRNNIEFFIASLAIQKLGAIVLPLFYTNKKAQYKSIFDRAHPKCVIANDYEIKRVNDDSSYV